MKYHRVAPAALATAVGFCALFVLSGCGNSPPAHPPPTDQAVIAEFQTISPPAGSTVSRGISTKAKLGATLVSSRYLSSLAQKKVAAEYAEVLAKRGWTRLKKFGNGTHWGESYCKGSLMASLEFLDTPPDAASAFEFGLSWSVVTENECS